MAYQKSTSTPPPPKPGTQLTVQMIASRFQMEQMDLFVIRDTVAKNASIAELFTFLYQARRLGLDPLLRQCYWIRGAFVTGIDGMRANAERTGEYLGSEAPQWCGDDGQWRDVWLDPKPPRWCKVGVKRKGRETQYTPVKFTSFFKAGVDSWKNMPEHMIAKVAEAAAIRKAFPQTFAGIYSNDEMGASGVIIEHDPNEKVGKPAQTPLIDADALDEVIDAPLKAEALPKNDAPAADSVDPTAHLIQGLRDAATKGLDSFDVFVDRHMEDLRRLSEADQGRYNGELQRLRQQHFQF